MTERYENLQVRVDTRNPRVRDTVREWVEPPLRFPFQCVLAPDRFVPVAGVDSDLNLGALWYDDFFH